MSRDFTRPPSRTVCEIAARLPAAVKNDDHARTAELLAQVRSADDLADLVVLLARCADRLRLTAATGLIADATLKELHAAYEFHRSRGVPNAEMPPYVRHGETAYQRNVRAARRERENRNAA